MSFEPTDPPTESAPGTDPTPLPDRDAPEAPVKRKKSLLFWGLLGVAAALVVFLAALALASYGQSTSTPKLRGYLPANTVAYFEVRADLPGDQRANLEAIAAKFPALAGTSLPARSEQLLDQILAKDQVSFSKDVEPWLAGSFGLAITNEAPTSMSAVATDIYPAIIGTPGAALAQTASSLESGVLLLVADKNDQLAAAWLDQQSGGKGQTYAGTTITVSGTSSSQLAYAIVDHIILVGSLSTVETALDTKGNSSLARSSGFVAAAKSAPANSLAFAYGDISALVSAAQKAALPPTSAVPGCITTSNGVIPASTWIAGSLRAETNALILTETMNLGTSGIPVGDHASAIAAHLPANTLAAVELRDLGPGLVKALDTLKMVGAGLACDPNAAASIASIGAALTLLGGAPALVGWMGDGAIAVVPNGTSFGGGLAVTVTDSAAANHFIDQAKTLLTLAASSITPSSQTYNGADLTLMNIPNSGGGISGMTIAATVSNGVFVLGTLDFVKATLDAKATTSLATNPRYVSIMSAAGDAGVSDVFVDLSALRTSLEPLLSAAAATSDGTGPLGTYDSQIKPNLDPLSALGLVVRTSATDVTTHLILTFAP